jgi:peptidoglycan/LPS O-acetylase OafA/YrhL
VAAPAALSPPAGNPRFPLLDAMRAIAALSVVAYHVAFFARATEHGWSGALLSRLGVGVTIFFVISGFVLYRPMVRARWDREPPRPLGIYASHRALRILPAYWLALTVLAIYPGLTGVFGDRWWVYYGFGQVYSGETILAGIGPAWSLCTEVVFYATLPLVAAGLGRAWRGGRRRGVRVELAVLGALGLASLCFRAAIEFGEQDQYLTQTFLGTFDGFALGMALAVVSVALAGRARQPAAVRLVTARPAVAWAVALACFVAAAAIGGPDPAFVLGTGVPAAEAIAVRVLGLAVAGALLAPAIFGDGAGGAPRRVLALPLLGWLGLISYGIYLWHFPIIQRVTVGASMEGFPGGNGWRIAAISVPIVIACAAVSYYAVERPLLRRKPRRSPPANVNTGIEERVEVPRRSRGAL